MDFVTKRLRWMLIGAGAAWLFDPAQGASRRERVSSTVRDLLDQAGLGSPPVPASSPVGPPASDVAWASSTSTMPPAAEPRAAAASADDGHLAASAAR